MMTMMSCQRVLSTRSLGTKSFGVALSSVGVVGNRSTVNYRRSNPLLSSSLMLQNRSLSFSFAGPRALKDIMKKELLDTKTTAEIADIWYTYHEARVSPTMVDGFVPSYRAFGSQKVVLLEPCPWNCSHIIG